MSDRALAIENAEYIFTAMADLGSEIEFKKDGIIQQRASFVLDKATELLEVMNTQGLFRSLELGTFANIKRPQDGGKGLAGAYEKQKDYFNPFIALLHPTGGVQ